MSEDALSVIPDGALKFALRRTLEDGVVMRLFTNNHMPTRRDTVDDYDELDGHGYEPIMIPEHAWTFETDRASALCRQQKWVLQEGERTLVYGYYLTHKSDGRLIEASRFADGPYALEAAFDQVKAQPRLTFSPKLRS